MADKAISELVAAQNVTPTDLFVLQQDNTAKKLTGQILENWLVSFADGHGGIQSYELLETVGLVKTYRFTLADQTYMDIDVVDGRGIESLKPTSTNGLEVTYTVTYNDGTTGTFTITNGAKGDKGDTANVWFKYASQEPTADSHSFGDVPDAWIGISSGHLTEAPTDWQQYIWYQWKGEKGDTGEPATLVSSEITYQAGDSGTIIPSGTWSSSVPVVAQGKYLWTREITQFNTGSPIIKYSVSRFGIDGTGAVSTVAGVSPDANGDVPLDAASVKALALAGGTMEGGINMNGQPLSGLNAPTADDEAANKGYVDTAKEDAESYTDEQVRKAAPRNLLDNSDFTNPVNQRGETSYNPSKLSYWLDRWCVYGAGTTFTLSDKKLIFSNDGSETCGMPQIFSADSLTVGKTYTLAVKGKVTGACYLSYGVTNTGNKESSAVLEQNVDTVHIYSFALPESEDGYYNFRIRSSAAAATGEIEWMALYEGEYTSDNLPVYQPKGYGAELAECQNYFERIGTDDLSFSIYPAYFAGSQTDLRSYISYRPKRVNPSINITVSMLTIVANGGYISASSVSIEPYKSGAYLSVKTSSATSTARTSAALLVSGYIDISADFPED